MKTRFPLGLGVGSRRVRGPVAEEVQGAIAHPVVIPTLWQRLGLGGGRPVPLDQVTLTSLRLGPTGRPDRAIKGDGKGIPEGWKSGRTPRPGHRAQLGVDSPPIEGGPRVRPADGDLGGGDGTRHRVADPAERRAWVLERAGQVRAARAHIGPPIPVQLVPGPCRPCGMRGRALRAGMRHQPDTQTWPRWSGREALQAA